MTFQVVYEYVCGGGEGEGEEVNLKHTCPFDGKVLQCELTLWLLATVRKYNHCNKCSKFVS